MGMYQHILTSLRSSKSGMSHKSDLSRRPGRSRAESMRSGRLEIQTSLVRIHWGDKDGHTW